MNVSSNRINFCHISNKLYIWPYTNAIICSFLRKMYLIQTNIYLAQRYFIWVIKCYLIQINLLFESKKAFQTNYFVLLNQIVFQSPSANLDTAQYWPSICKNVAEDRLPISCRCWNDNSGMHLAANSGPNSSRQYLLSAQQRVNAVPNSSFLTSRIVCHGKSNTWPSNVPSMGRTLTFLILELPKCEFPKPIIRHHIGPFSAATIRI